MNDVSGLEIVADLATASATLPNWWQFKNTGACRATSLSMSAIADPSDVNCPDWSAGGSFAGIGAYQVGKFGPNPGRILVASAVPASNLVALTGKAPYLALSLSINHAKTVGTGACSGCNVGACITLNQIKVTTADPNVWRTRKPWTLNAADAWYVTWQGGGAVSTGLGTGCPAAVPVKSRTWGQVKSLYR